MNSGANDAVTGPFSKITLVMPTYNRQAQALKSVRFWGELGVKVNVVDGSEQSLSESQVNDLPTSVSYYHRPISLPERLLEARNLVETPFAALIGDDELFVPSGIAACVSMLENNPEILGCMGRCLAFKKVDGGVNSWPAYTEMAGHMILSDSPVDRLRKHMNPYTCSSIYSIMRTSQWKTFINNTIYTSRARYLDEIVFELSAAMAGKLIVLPVVYWLRNLTSPPIREVYPDLGQIAPLSKWWLGSEYAQERHVMLARLAENLAELNLGSKRKIASMISAALDEYVIGQGEWPAGRKRRIFPGLFRAVPKAAAPVTAIPSMIHPSLIEGAEELGAVGVFFDRDEIRRMEDFIASW